MQMTEDAVVVQAFLGANAVDALSQELAVHCKCHCTDKLAQTSSAIHSLPAWKLSAKLQRWAKYY